MTYRDLADVFERYQHAPEFDGVVFEGPNQRGIFGNRLLNTAAMHGDIQAIEILLEAGAEINGRGENECTPLHDAAANNHLEIVVYLLDHGASPDCVDEDGATAQDLAKLLKNERIVEAISSFIAENG